MPNKITNIIAAILLIIMFFSAVTSMRDDSLTMDEQAHIPAGYSYLSQQDYRLNPEHPPLIKDLAALPLLFLNLNFPKNHQSWTGEVNSQWWFGSEFLYRSGNDPDKILFYARLPMILVLLFLGWFIFYWARELGGNKVALLALTLFSFSPTFLAHGRLVTTDVGAALGAAVAIYFWLKFLKNPTKKSVISAGLAFGAALLIKFTMAMLIPLFAAITLIFAWIKSTDNKNLLTNILRYAGLALLAAAIGALLIFPVYQFHVLNYPPEKQAADTQYILASSPLKKLAALDVWMADKPILRTWGHYLFGLLMATQRTASGNTSYFLGMVSSHSWWYYFPVVYFLKVPLAVHILTIIALFYAIFSIKKPGNAQEFKNRLNSRFTEFAMLTFMAIYWFVSMAGNLNIGVRHILPTFPFMYILVSLGIIKWTENIKNPVFKKTATSLISILLGWYIIASVSVWPNYLTYFNEIAGGPANGYKYVVDSNLDWGQDLKRLAIWTEDNKIDKIYVDYFGGGNAKYYLKEKYLPWWGTKNPDELPKGGYLAVSATLLQSGRGKPAFGFNQPTDYYVWLNQYEPPVAKIGNSIFVYYIK